MKKTLIATLFFLALSVQCHANNEMIDSVGVDRFAHAGISYMICDQLKRNCGMNDFWAGFCTLAIGAGKEILIDKKWDDGDFTADCCGVLFYQIKF